MGELKRYHIATISELDLRRRALLDSATSLKAAYLLTSETPITQLTSEKQAEICQLPMF